MKKEKSEKIEEMKKEDRKRPDKESLIAEYKALNDSKHARSRDMLLVESIMIPSILTIVTFSIIYRDQFGVNICGFSNSGFVPIIGFFLLAFLLNLRRTSNKINDIIFRRIREIEKELQIEGHRYIRERTRCETWFMFRHLTWYLIFALIMSVCVFATIHLFIS